MRVARSMSAQLSWWSLGRADYYWASFIFKFFAYMIQLCRLHFLQYINSLPLLSTQGWVLRADICSSASIVLEHVLRRNPNAAGSIVNQSHGLLRMKLVTPMRKMILRTWEDILINRVNVSSNNITSAFVFVTNCMHRSPEKLPNKILIVSKNNNKL